MLSVDVDGAAGERLLSLGIKAGARVTALAFSVFSGGVLIGVGYNRVALRKTTAQKITVKKAEAEKC